MLQPGDSESLGSLPGLAGMVGGEATLFPVVFGWRREVIV